jgi:hypothetical protein
VCCKLKGYLISIPLQDERPDSQMRQGLEGWQFQALQMTSIDEYYLTFRVVYD